MERLWLFMALVVGLIAGGSLAGWGQDAIVLYGRLIDGTGAPAVEEGALVIVDERIEAVGIRADIVVPEEATIIDLETATILPGFIDTHVHKAYSAKYLRRWAAAGVTTVRDLGGDVALDWDGVRDDLAQDPTLASLVISGPLLSVPDGYAMNHPLNCGIAAGSPAEARSITYQVIQQGVDCIKIAIESVYTEGATEVMSPEVAQAIVSAAHQRGVPVIAHAIDYADIAVAVEAGVDQLAHIVKGSIPLDALQDIADRGIIWVTTLILTGSRGSAHLKHFAEMGGIVALGTDDGAVRFPSATMPIDELRRMFRSGLDPMDVIVASTRNAALACGIERRVGTLEAGKRADILVVEGDPLADLQALGEPLLVMHHGVIIRDERESGSETAND